MICVFADISLSSQPVRGRGIMATPPDGYGDAQKPRVKLKRGSSKYLHLQKFIETRRQKKRAKRCTLDPSAKVTFP